MSEPRGLVGGTRRRRGPHLGITKVPGISRVLSRDGLGTARCDTVAVLWGTTGWDLLGGYT